MVVSRLLAAIVALAASASLAAPLHAGPADKAPANAATPAPKAKTETPPALAAQPTADKPQVPGTNKMTLLIQSHMSALSQAIATENYTVLRALGAPAYQSANSPEKLSQTFAKFKTDKIDFSPVILFTPVLVQQPAIDEHGMLRLTGFYKTEPQNVHFDMLFQLVSGNWRLFGISAQTHASQAAANSAAPEAK